MNALSGKFGQKIVVQSVQVLAKMPEDPDKFFKDLKNVSIEMIESMTIDKFASEGNIGYLITGDKKEEDMRANLPTYLSVFILAHSRRVMSKMLRYVDGYRNRQRTVYYTDTDSMIVNQETFDLLQPKFIGSQLGLLEDEFPKDIIVAGRFLAPKTYCLALLKPYGDHYVLAYKVRCKGIPHRGDIFEARTYYAGDDVFNKSLETVNEEL